MTSTQLSDNPQEALQQLISTAEQLLAIMDQEAAALAQKDSVKFSALQSEKEQITENYQALARTFQDRIKSFRGADQARLDKLERLQDELKNRAEDTQRQMDNLSERANG